MKKISKIFLCVFVIVITFSFFACERTKPIIDERNIVVDGNKVYIGNYNEKTIIKVDYFNIGYGDDWIYEQAKEFVYENQEYAIFFKGDPFLVTQYNNRLEAGRNLSDLYIAPYSSWYQFAATGDLEPITDVFNSKPDGEEGKTVLEKLADNYAEGAQYTNSAGKTDFFVMPWTQMVTGIVYNAELFERYNLEVPKTINELIAVSEEIITKSTNEGKRIAPFVVPGRIGGYFDFLGTAWWLQASGIDKVKEFFALESPEVFNPAIEPTIGKQKALEAFKTFFGSGANEHSKYVLTGSMQKDAYTAQLDFLNGNAAMIINGNWFEQEMSELIESMNFRAKMMPAPFLTDAQKDENDKYISINYAAGGFDFMSIPSKAANKEGAKKFMAFMLRDDMLKRFAVTTGSVRPFESDYESIMPNLSEFSRSVIEIIENSSESYFDLNTGKFKYSRSFKFLTSNPYISIVNGNNPSTFVASEYQEAKVRWNNEWKDIVNS